MIQNESLSERLNEFKNNQQNPETNHNPSNIIPANSIINSLVSLLVIFIKSFVFGYGLKTLINANWNFLGYVCIGMGVTFLIEFILDILSYFS